MRTSVRSVALVVACMSTAAQATEWRVTPRFSLSETYSDNVLLSPASTAKADWITQVSPGIAVEANGADLRLSADYNLQNVIYANENNQSKAYQQLSAKANATLVENTLFLDAGASIQQQATSLLAPISNNNLNPGNVADIYTYSISPYLKHRFGSTAVGQIRFTQDSMTSGVGGLSDSTASRVDATLNSGAAFANLGWSLAYNQEKIDYQLRPDVETKVFTGTASYMVFPKLQAIATLGYEKSNYVYSGEQPKGDFWSAGINWSPTTQTSLNASAGERYFGKTYALGMSHRTRETVWRVNYSQDVTSTRTELLNPVIYNAAINYYQSLLALGQTPSFASVLANRRLLASYLGIPDAVLGNQVYLSKQFIASVTVSHGKHLMTLSVNSSVREGLEKLASLLVSGASTNIVKQYGLNANWDMRVSPRDTLNAGLGVSRSVFPDLSRTDNSRNFKAGMTRRLEKQLTGSLDYRHVTHTSDASGADYRENAITGKLMWTF